MRFAVSPVAAKQFVAVWLVLAAVEMDAADPPASVEQTLLATRGFPCISDSGFFFRQAPADTEGDFGNYRS